MVDNFEKKALLVEDAEENDDNLLDNHTIIDIGSSNSKLTPTKLKSDNSGKLGRLQNQVDDVVDVMKINIEKVVDRGQSLNELNERSENLSTSGDLFSKRSRNLRKSMWFRTCRARLYFGLTLGFILILIICKFFNFYAYIFH
jgi:vesicle-associated membrane protein 4